MSSTIYKVKFRRRREQKTDYKKRLASLKSKKLRMVFRKSNRYINVQLIEYKDGVDVTNVHVNSRDLEKFGWMGNASQASSYLTGYLFGKRALQKGYKEAIFDLGMNTPAHGGRAFSALKGALDAGLTVPHSEEALPKEERFTGQHIQAYAEKLGDDTKKQFSRYGKKNIDVKNLTSLFAKAKTEIDKNAQGAVK